MCGCAPCGGTPPPKPPRPDPPDGGTPPKPTPPDPPDPPPKNPNPDDPGSGGGLIGHRSSLIPHIGPRNPGDPGPDRRIFHVVLSEPRQVGVSPPFSVERAHADHLLDLTATGQLLGCGLFETLDRGLMLINARSKEEAESLVHADPLLTSGYYSRVEIVELLSPAPAERRSRNIETAVPDT